MSSLDAQKSVIIDETETSIYLWNNKQEKRWTFPSLTEFTDKQNWQRSCTEP